jgi:hypothetical protein
LFCWIYRIDMTFSAVLAAAKMAVDAAIMAAH